MTASISVRAFQPNRRIFALGALVSVLPLAHGAEAATASELDRDGRRALRRLLAADATAREVSAKSLGVLIFPKIAKAGFIVGAQGGAGVLKVRGQPPRYYSIAAASFGLQAGIQSFSYALFFMTPSALDYLAKSDGWAIGSGPSIVVADKGVAKTLNTTTLKKDIYAFPFGQAGLMAGLGLEGSKITPIHPKP